ncbi:hypothetical protein ALON55S_07352 [Alishewanella longhuensis]
MYMMCGYLLSMIAAWQETTLGGCSLILVCSILLKPKMARAIAILQQQMFDLVVTDYNMPEVNGQELTQFIREHSTLSHIPVLMVTMDPTTRI